MDIILALLEYLVDNLLSVANICSYLAALRTMFIINNLPTHSFRDEKIQMFVKSVRINRPLVVKRDSIFTEQILPDIIAATETLETLESRTSTSPTASTTATIIPSPPPPPPTPEKKKATKHMGHALDTSKTKKKAAATSLADLIH